ncbi:KTSC domain-containing protein [Longimicrobium sp.]|jgi:hypothetical protein|uniref:KTSC domain-containing protein n=1 Tax=Longimicrobium sp. TaxID=2029185 RepID=UPI0032C20D2E
MNYVAVTSSNIAAIGYDEHRGVLGVRFRAGREYWYSGVSRSVYQSFLGAGSKGRYFETFVKRLYGCVRVG